ncbi:MAG: hypothetical protein ACRCWJ_21205 [Casimicrobium sp.]
MPRGGHRDLVPYDDDAAQHLLTWIADGNSLKSWCESDPFDSGKRFSIAVVYRWLKDNSDFSKAYAQAREDRVDTLVEEMIDIAADATDDAYIRYVDGKPVAAIDGTAIRRAELMIRTRQWVAEKMRPAHYGNRIDVTSGGQALGAPIKDAAERLHQIMVAAMARQAGQFVPVVTVDAKFVEVEALPAPKTPSLDDLLS